MRYFTFFITVFIIPLSSFSEENLSNRSQEDGLFSSDETLEIVLKTDLKNLLKNKDEGKYQEGKIILEDKTYPVRLKARGNYRRENCSFPPIMLNFSKTEFEDKSYDQLKKLKLVNACKMQVQYEQYILSEYMIYKTFNLMTDKSFKVKLLKIDYVDSKEKMNTITRYGFVIEDEYMMASRLEGTIIKKKGIREQSTNKEQIVMLSIFQFLMGNTDWQLPILQNLKLLKLNDITETTPYVIPYDFDYTGMVNASYAIPSPILGIDNIRERLYWGKCYSEEELQKATDTFLQKKGDIYALYTNFGLFNKANLKQSLSYLDSFYEIVENDKKWQHYFIKNCRK